MNSILISEGDAASAAADQRNHSCGLPHILEYENALGDPNWTPLVSRNGTGEILSLTVPAPTGGARFYPIRVGP